MNLADSKHFESPEHHAAGAALRFITCGSVDDGKSTLIGRLLVDSKAVLQDQLESVSKSGETDLALLTDGLSAEREQGITIDVAYRYFATPKRKFIIGDAPGHEQYTRNMVTAASSADAAVVLVDASKLAWQSETLSLLPQTRRHSLLSQLLRVPSIVFAVNKLDAVADPSLAFKHISAALSRFAAEAKIQVAATVPISALKGYNVVTPYHADTAGWAGYSGPSLLEILETLPAGVEDASSHFCLPVQWVEKFSSSSDTSQGRRVFWGRIAAGSIQAKDAVTVFPSGQSAIVAKVLDHVRNESATPLEAGASVGVILDREVDVSRGDYLLSEGAAASKSIRATLAWLDDEPLVIGRLYWALHGHRWVKTKVSAIHYSLNIEDLSTADATEIKTNGIGSVELQLLEAIPSVAFKLNKRQGALILIDPASNHTAAAVMVE